MCPRALIGAAFLTRKTKGRVQERRGRSAAALAAVLAVAWPLATWATVKVNPWLFRAFVARPLAWSAAALALAGLVAVFVGLRRGRDLLPFLGSSGLIVGLLVATAASVFPVMLRASGGEALSITAYSGSNDE